MWRWRRLAPKPFRCERGQDQSSGLLLNTWRTLFLFAAARVVVAHGRTDQSAPLPFFRPFFERDVLAHEPRLFKGLRDAKHWRGDTLDESRTAVMCSSCQSACGCIFNLNGRLRKSINALI